MNSYKVLLVNTLFTCCAANLVFSLLLYDRVSSGFYVFLSSRRRVTMLNFDLFLGETNKAEGMQWVYVIGDVLSGQSIKWHFPVFVRRWNKAGNSTYVQIHFPDTFPNHSSDVDPLLLPAFFPPVGILGAVVPCVWSAMLVAVDWTQKLPRLALYVNQTPDIIQASPNPSICQRQITGCAVETKRFYWKGTIFSRVQTEHCADWLCGNEEYLNSCRTGLSIQILLWLLTCLIMSLLALVCPTAPDIQANIH